MRVPLKQNRFVEVDSFGSQPASMSIDNKGLVFPHGYRAIGSALKEEWRGETALSEHDSVVLFRFEGGGKTNVLSTGFA
jgi:hypothetical protein